MREINREDLQTLGLSKTLIGLVDNMKVLRSAIKGVQERVSLPADGYSAGIIEYEKLLRAKKAEVELRSSYLQTLSLYHIIKSEIELISGVL